MTISEWQKLSYDNAKAHGFWDEDSGEPIDPQDRRVLAEKFELMHEEISEAWGEVRNGVPPTKIYDNPDGSGKPEGVPIELADAVIRIMDLCQALGVDLESAIAAKYEYNRKRPFKHGRTC